MRRKTIEICLLDGNPKGIQYISSPLEKVVQAYYIPRDDMSNPKIVVKKELEQPAIYFLYTEDKKEAYIGQTSKALNRIKQHNEKIFWDSALVFIATGNALTKADVKYLEYRAITLAKEYNRVKLDENKVTPSKPQLSDGRFDALDDFFDDIILFSSFLHIDWFDEKQKDTDIKLSEKFYINVDKKNGVKIEAEGVYNKETKKFTLLKDSKLAKEAEISLTNYMKVQRQALFDNLDMVKEETTYYILKESQEFTSPSTAAKFCLGRSSDGWTQWKNKEGTTLDAVYRNVKDEEQQ